MATRKKTSEKSTNGKRAVRARGANRGHRYRTPVELKAATLRFCETKFRELFGKPWSKEFRERMAGVEWKGDIETHAALEALGKAVNRVLALGLEKRGLLHGLSSQLQAIHQRVRGYKRPRFAKAGTREYIFDAMEDGDPFRVGPSFPDAHEMAVVSVLCGNWPSKPTATTVKRDGATPAEVIEIEAETFRKQMARHGTPPLSGSDGVEPVARGVRHRVSVTRSK